MEQLLLTALDRYGPLGAALIVVCFVLVLFVYKVVPWLTEAHGKRLDGLIDAFRETSGLVNGRLDQHEAHSVERHGELTSTLGRIESKVDRIVPPPHDGDD